MLSLTMTGLLVGGEAVVARFLFHRVTVHGANWKLQTEAKCQISVRQDCCGGWTGFRDAVIDGGRGTLFEGLGEEIGQMGRE